MDHRDEPNRNTDSYRRRSPDGYDRRGMRRRSRSPPNIDRYQPGRRDDFYRQRDDAHRRRVSPPPMQAGIDRYVPGHEAPPMTVNPVQSPMAIDFQVGFTYYAEWWRYEQRMKQEKDKQRTGNRRPDRLKSEAESREERAKERELIQADYDNYKEKLQVQMAKSFVKQHQHDEWFKERYYPEIYDEFRKRMIETRREVFFNFSRELEAGLFDEFTLEGIYKSDSNGAGGIVEREEGETTATHEVLGVGDLLPTPGGNIRDPAASQPTLLIKTLTPTIGRTKMEAFCKEHLGEGPGGFKWLSLSDPNPQKKFHRIGWVMLHPDNSDHMVVDSRGDGRDDDTEDGVIKSEDGNAADTKSSVAEKAVVELNGKVFREEGRGDFTCHVGVHSPAEAPRKKALWDLFSVPERVDRDLDLAIRLSKKLDAEFGEEYDGCGKIEQHVENLRAKGWLQPPINAHTAGRSHDPEDMDEDEDEGMIEEDEGAAEEDADDEELLAKKKRLDIMVEYLRRVHNFCMFCVFECDSVHELMRKCPGGHLRRPRATLSSAAKVTGRATATSEPFPFKKNESKDDGEANGDEGEGSKPKMASKMAPKTQQQLQRAYNWVKTYEEKVMQILEPENVDVKKLGGKPLEEGVEDELGKHVKQEDESKWRCKAPDCTKLFKGQLFWRKHVEKRHKEFLDKIKHEVQLVNNYVLDPAHIAPSRNDANSNGHFPMGYQGQAGTPRGFNMNNVQQIRGPQPFSNGIPTPIQLAAIFSHTGNPSQAFAGAEDERRGGGPIRRGGGRFNNRAGGPYDRPNQDGRNPRGGQRHNTGNNARQTSPARNAAGRPQIGGGRFDNASASVGPREAVHGRSLRSYEDLDAAGASGGGAENQGLDY